MEREPERSAGFCSPRFSLSLAIYPKAKKAGVDEDCRKGFVHSLVCSSWAPAEDREAAGKACCLGQPTLLNVFYLGLRWMTSGLGFWFLFLALHLTTKCFVCGSWLLLGSGAQCQALWTGLDRIPSWHP